MEVMLCHWWLWTVVSA